jgi:hypothetical protein
MDKVLSELEDYQGTTLGDLLNFMQAFNLRFGAANSYKQKLIYQKLYLMLAEQANSLPGSTSGDATAVASDVKSTVDKVGAAADDVYDRLKSAAVDFFKAWK